MNLLLDTHVLIWWMQGSKRIGPRARAALFETGVRLWLSPASVWEMSIKSAAGRLRLDSPLEESISSLSKHGVRSLPISVRHALALRPRAVALRPASVPNGTGAHPRGRHDAEEADQEPVAPAGNHE